MDGSNPLLTARVEWTHETVYWPRKKEPEMTAEERADKIAVPFTRNAAGQEVLEPHALSEEIAAAIRQAEQVAAAAERTAVLEETKGLDLSRRKQVVRRLLWDFVMEGLFGVGFRPSEQKFEYAAMRMESVLLGAELQNTRDAVAEEREACAKEAESFDDGYHKPTAEFTKSCIAFAIRARSTAPAALPGPATGRNLGRPS